MDGHPAAVEGRGRNGRFDGELPPRGGFAMGIQFWRTPVRSLVLLALMLTGCATGGDLSTHDMPAIANRTYVLVGASSGFGQCLEAIFRFLANRGCRPPFL
jgi:hypothetical protein